MISGDINASYVASTMGLESIDFVWIRGASDEGAWDSMWLD